MRRVYWLMAAELPAQPLWLQAQGYGRFCFVNSDDCLLVGNHAMTPTRFEVCRNFYTECL
jgi:hypothetical protein